jgi:uncharacterized YigZ family protein
MTVFSYLTIQGPCEGLYKEKGSKFLAFAYPVSSEVEIRDHIRNLRKKYHDARHQGFGYIIGPDQKTWRAFDDGEPNHSTGDPILGQIRSRKITNVLVVVVRYFGGTKLGVSGLIGAYRAAANDALSKSTIVEREVMTVLEIEFEFPSTPEVMKLVKDFDLGIDRQEFSDKGHMNFAVRLRVHEEVLKKISLLNAQGSSIVIIPNQVSFNT